METLEGRKEMYHRIQAVCPPYDDLVEHLDFGSQSALENLYDLQSQMNTLTFEYEQQNSILDEEIQAQEIREKPIPPDDDACQFVDKAFSAALCTCSHNTQQHIRLRLGTHKALKTKPKPTSLCVLISRGGTQESLPRWHEVEICAEQEEEYVTIINAASGGAQANIALYAQKGATTPKVHLRLLGRPILPYFPTQSCLGKGSLAALSRQTGQEDVRARTRTSD